MKNENREALLKACRVVGGQKKLAEKINVQPSLLNKWINRKNKYRVHPIPYWYALAIEEVTGGVVTCCELMPDWEKVIVHCCQQHGIERLHRSGSPSASISESEK